MRLLTLLLFMSLPLCASWNLLSSTCDAGTGTSGTTTGIDTTGADLLVFAEGLYEPSGIPPSIIDHIGINSNTYTQATTWGGTGGGQSVFFFVHNPTFTGAGHTVAFVGGFPGGCFTAWTGSAASPFDQENGGGSASGSSATQATGSVTPTQDGELAVTAGTFFATTPYTVDSGFTSITTSNVVGGNGAGMGIAYKVQTSASAVNPTWTQSSSNLIAASVITFKGSAPAAVTRRRLIQ